MNTSIFNMTLTLPPLIEMTDVEKDMPTATLYTCPGPYPDGMCGRIVRRPI